MIVKRVLDALASVVCAAPCRICDEALLDAGRIPICGECLESFERVREPMCRVCGRPFASAVAAEALVPLCHLCRTGFYAFDRARSYAIYGDALFEAIVLMKYEEVTRLGDWFAGRLAKMEGLSGEEWAADVLTAVPLHRERQRERGYNQAELIARPLARRLGMRMDSRLLMRVKARPPRLLLSRNERWKSVHGAYVTRPGQRVDKLRVLLIDDVLTTGATLDACARVLKEAGASKVLALTVGRSVPGWPLAGAARKKIPEN